MNTDLTEQTDQLSPYLHRGFHEASMALSKWLDRRLVVVLEQVQLLRLESAIETLGPADEIQCACCMRFTGGFTGQLALAFDDTSGWELCDILFHREHPSTEWGELEISALLETTNILGCSLLNSFSLASPPAGSIGPMLASGVDATWMPTSPPVFVRDFAASIMESILVNQGSTMESVILAKTKWEVESRTTHLQLLLLPDGTNLVGAARVAN
ncbi:MAG: hypothetical protein MUD03_14990 [Pirellula sp.]|jgi:chemotaxis protein CheC|nr:hypothetical protein [Pirellula sp.]